MTNRFFPDTNLVYFEYVALYKGRSPWQWICFRQADTNLVYFEYVALYKGRSPWHWICFRQAI